MSLGRVVMVCIILQLSLSGDPPPLPDQLALAAKPMDILFEARMGDLSANGYKKYLQAIQLAQKDAVVKKYSPFAKREWQCVGPDNFGGRVNSIAIHPLDHNIIYLGFASGGIFKTIDAGKNWAPIFDQQPFTSIGSLVVDPQSPTTIYAGTGDPNVTIYPFIGNGVYKSTDAGASWEHLGLSEQRIISRLILHPHHSHILYAACMGLPFAANNQRGVYRSMDGGSTWQQILFVSPNAGIIDMVMDPSNPKIIFAAGWDRIRSNNKSIVNGLNAKIFKTADGGNTWKELSSGLPKGNLGRIGLAIAPSDPQVIYASYVNTSHQLEGIYRSKDGGSSWLKITEQSNLDNNALGGFGWYFGQLRVAPGNSNELYLLGVHLWRSFNGGQSWEIASSPWGSYVHPDMHDLVFDSSGNMYLGTDGGLYKSADKGYSWQDIEDTPTSQFYRIAFNPHKPDWYYGGMQDNGTATGALYGKVWEQIYGADGFQMIFDPMDPNSYFVETQNGGILMTNDNGQFWQYGSNGLDSDVYRNWDMPFMLSRHNPNVLYTATYRLFRSDAISKPLWKPVSPILTQDPFKDPRFHSISAIAESPLDKNLLYTGATDGLVWRTDNGGDFWFNITDGLPESYVTSIVSSSENEDRVFVSLSSYRDNDFNAKIFKSDNRGTTWSPLAGSGLPDFAVNDICVIPGTRDEVIFVATDGGVWGTVDAGENWHRLGADMPFVPVFDLEYHAQKRMLGAGTFGRSFQVFFLDDVLKISSTSKPLINISQWIQLFPNPASERVNIRSNAPEHTTQLSCRLYDTKGTLLHYWPSLPPGGSLEINNLPAGVYQLEIRSNNKARALKKLVISR